jgi:hypothetical protein
LIAAALVIALLAGAGQGILPWHQAANPRLLIGFGVWDVFGRIYFANEEP